MWALRHGAVAVIGVRGGGGGRRDCARAQLARAREVGGVVSPAAVSPAQPALLLCVWRLR
jgi:hypothetical protein